MLVNKWAVKRLLGLWCGLRGLLCSCVFLHVLAMWFRGFGQLDAPGKRVKPMDLEGGGDAVFNSWAGAGSPMLGSRRCVGEIHHAVVRGETLGPCRRLRREEGFLTGGTCHPQPHRGGIFTIVLLVDGEHGELEGSSRRASGSLRMQSRPAGWAKMGARDSCGTPGSRNPRRSCPIRRRPLYYEEICWARVYRRFLKVRVVSKARWSSSFL